MAGLLGTPTNSPVVDTGTNVRDATKPPGTTCVTRIAPSYARNNDISPTDGKKILDEAATWKGTPYALMGENSKKGVSGDCSGSTSQIYKAAGFPYDHQAAATFRDYSSKSMQFREIDITKEQMQAGDVLSWTDHLAIYGPNEAFAKEEATNDRISKKSGKHWTEINNIWTATHPDGPPYHAAELRYFRGTGFKVYRYQRGGGVCAD